MADWPLWGPALIAAMACACLQAAVWGLRGSPVLQKVACFALAWLLMYWLETRRYPVESGAVMRETWPAVTPLEATVLVLAIAAAYVLAVLGLVRDRRGDTVTLKSLYAWLPAIASTSVSETSDFASPSEAQFWFEWRRPGRYVPLLIGSVALGLALVCLSPWAPRGEVWSVIMVVAIAVAYLLAVLGLVRDRRGDTVTLKSLYAWLPAIASTSVSEVSDFASPRSAQLWFEWHRRGRYLPLFIGSLALGLAVGLPVSHGAPLETSGRGSWGSQ